MKKIVFILLVLSLTNSESYSQKLPDSVVSRIDNLFQKWDKTSVPGCAIGIVRNDTLIYAKGYGMANLENGIPISPETVFYMASVSKQFTGYSIILLARQGKLTLDDDIRKYLPWIHDFGKTLTIRHLLNHTSGLRDDITLAAITGLGYDGMLTQELAINLIKNQTSLNFDPGERYSYSNSNYVLLAEIVKTASGKSFRSFADSAIFKPLGMVNSQFQDNYAGLIKNRALSYSGTRDNKTLNSFQNVYTVGDGGLFSNINDMAKWVINLYSPLAGDQKDIEQLTWKGKLNNGKEITYASGIGNSIYNGRIKYSHSGGLAGYRTYVSAFPELKMGFIVFSNDGDFNSSAKANEMADIFTTPGIINNANLIDQNDNNKLLIKDISIFRKYMGDYVDEDGTRLNFNLNEGKMSLNVQGQSFNLYQFSRDTIALATRPETRFLFSISGNDTVATQYSPGETRIFRKYIAGISLTNKQLQSYTGTYYSLELDCNYGIELRDQKLILTSNKYEDTEISLIGSDDLYTNNWWMGHMKVLRDNKNMVTGFEINDGHIMHLRFIKMKE
jgi:CubicO group peptidase (beta-lactamase class C family)